MDRYDALQLAAGWIMAGGYIPQVFKLLKVRTSREISLAWLTMLLVAMLMVDVYALGDWGARFALFISNTIVMVLCSIVLSLAIYYRVKKGG